MLSSVLAGGTDLKEIIINDWDWYKENRIQLHAGHTVNRIDTLHRKVFSEQGAVASYDALIIATGSNPFMLPLPGAEKEGVIAFRDIQDCETMVKTSQQYKKAVVIGGGLLGLEAARGLLHLGMDVSVVHLNPYLMERQLTRRQPKCCSVNLKHKG